MTQVNGYGYEPPSQRPPQLVLVVPPDAVDLGPPEPEWIEILRGLGIATCLISVFILAPCALLAIGSGAWPVPWYIRVPSVMIVGAGVLALIVSGMARALRGGDVDYE